MTGKHARPKRCWRRLKRHTPAGNRWRSAGAVLDDCAVCGAPGIIVGYYEAKRAMGVG